MFKWKQRQQCIFCYLKVKFSWKHIAKCILINYCQEITDSYFSIQALNIGFFFSEKELYFGDALTVLLAVFIYEFKSLTKITIPLFYSVFQKSSLRKGVITSCNILYSCCCSLIQGQLSIYKYIYLVPDRQQQLSLRSGLLI